MQTLVGTSFLVFLKLSSPSKFGCFMFLCCCCCCFNFQNDPLTPVSLQFWVSVSVLEIWRGCGSQKLWEHIFLSLKQSFLSLNIIFRFILCRWVFDCMHVIATCMWLMSTEDRCYKPLVPHSTSFRMDRQHLGFQLFWLPMLNCLVYADMHTCENLPNQKHL